MSDPIIRCAHTRVIPTAEAMLLRREKNPNCHPPEQLRMLGKIIGATGWRSPVTISKRSGRMTKGHGRTEAASLAGFPVVPIDEQDYESEEQEIADVLADNLIADMAELDPALAKELAEALKVANFDTEIAGLTNDAFAALMEPAKVTELREVKIQEPPKMAWVLIGIPTVRFGEISEAIEKLSGPGVIVETTVSNEQK